MKCPSCGNFAKMPSGLFFGLSLLSFKCQFCNERLRGNIVMVFLDLASFVSYIVFLIYLLKNGEHFSSWFGELSFPILGVGGAFAIRMPMTWLKMHIGKYVLAR
jgi:hypothetical protein